MPGMAVVIVSEADNVARTSSVANRWQTMMLCGSACFSTRQARPPVCGRD